MSGGGVRTEGGRNLPWWQFILLVLVYAAIIQGGGGIIGADVDSDEAFETAGNLLESSLIPIGLSSVFAIGIATWLGWWPQIIHEPLRTQAIIVCFTGYMLYLTRRWAGAIWLAMPVHASQDFMITSGQIGVDPDTSVLSFVVLPTMVGLAILLWRRRHRISIEGPQPPSQDQLGASTRPPRTYS